VSRYYFVIRAKDGRYNDPSGSEHADIESATAYAHRIIEELTEGGHPPRDYVALDVQDETRRTVLSISFGKEPSYRGK
jgi:Domain of unknown function (DUF6894)